MKEKFFKIIKILSLEIIILVIISIGFIGILLYYKIISFNFLTNTSLKKSKEIMPSNITVNPEWTINVSSNDPSYLVALHNEKELLTLFSSAHVFSKSENTSKDENLVKEIRITFTDEDLSAFNKNDSFTQKRSFYLQTKESNGTLEVKVNIPEESFLEFDSQVIAQSIQRSVIVAIFQYLNTVPIIDNGNNQLNELNRLADSFSNLHPDTFEIIKK